MSRVRGYLVDGLSRGLSGWPLTWGHMLLRLLSVTFHILYFLQPELKTTNFQYYLGLQKPLVILFTDQTESDLHDTLGSLVKDSRFPAATLAWMNT